MIKDGSWLRDWTDYISGAEGKTQGNNKFQSLSILDSKQLTNMVLQTKSSVLIETNNETM